MSIEQRSEIPGYQWHHFEGVDLYIPAPVNWTFDRSTFNGQTNISVFELTKMRERFYAPCLALSITKNFEEAVGVSGEIFARDRLLSMPAYIPRADVETYEDGPIIISKRPFAKPEEFTKHKIGEIITETVRLPESLCYFMLAFNRDTGTGYLGSFATPIEKPYMLPIGKTMIDNMTLSRVV